MSAAVALAAIGYAAFVILASTGVAPSSPFFNRALPQTEGAVPSGVWWLVVPFVLSAACALLALGLRLYGRKRRARFFEQLGVA